MMKRLSTKLTLAMVLVSALTIVLASYLIDRAMDKQFQSFVEASQQQLNQQVVEAVKAVYRQDGSRLSIEEQLGLLGAASNVEILIVPENRHHGMMMGRGMMGHSPMAMNRRTIGQMALPDGTAATIEVIPTLTWEQADRETAFRRAVNGSVFLAAVLSLGSAFLISTLFSWRLTKPVQQLTTLVRKVGQGELQERARLKGQDELSFLGQEFNQMAANLEKQERLRLKLTNDMAHELRTPLTSIQAYLEAMGDGVLDPSKDNLHLVLEETQRLNELLERLRELAKLEAPLVHKQPVELNQLIEGEVRSLRILAEEKGLSFIWQRVQNVTILGDPKLLATAVRNVILNAIKYTQASGTVTVSLSEEGTMAKIEVTDTGIGIEAQELPFIFERFYRTDTSRSRETGGTGIGLAVASELIRSHGGSLDVQSELGQGSVFMIRLPKIA